MIIFLHLHKCGGTSFVHYMKKLGKKGFYTTNGNDRNMVCEDIRNRIMQYESKVDFICYEGLKPELRMGLDYISIFRHPVARHISNYHYDKKNLNIPSKTSFLEYSQGKNIYVQGNYITKWFLGLRFCDYIDIGPKEIEYVKGELDKIKKIYILEWNLPEDFPCINSTHYYTSYEDRQLAEKLNYADLLVYDYACQLSALQRSSSLAC